MSPWNATRRRLLKGAAALSAGALGGCIVTPYGPYYRPASNHPGAKYKGAWCQGVAGPLAVVEVPLAPGVKLTARAERGYAERDRADLPLRMELTVPPSQPFRFSGPLKVSESGTGRPLGGEPQVHVFRLAALAPDAWVDAPRLRPSGSAGVPSRAESPYGSAAIELEFEPGYAPETFRIDGLVLTHEAGRNAMPAVSLTRQSGKLMGRDYRSPEMHAQLERKADACRRDTPKLACDNIVQFSSISFETDSADVRWSGRWYVLGDGPRARLDGSIDVAPRKPGRWRIAGDAVTVRDAAGEVRQGRVSGIRVAVNDRIALDTPLFTGPVDGTGDAQVSIEVALPAGAPDFDVVLPDVLLGSQRIAGPSIRFDRRTFDGGIEPFNC